LHFIFLFFQIDSVVLEFQNEKNTSYLMIET